MDFDSIRPILSGLAGGAIATWLGARWARNAPGSIDGKSIERLRRDHRIARWVANCLFFAGLGGAFVLYARGGYSNTDVFPLALGWGVACTAPLIGVVLTSWLLGRSAREALLVLVSEEGAPPTIVILALASGWAALTYALYLYGRSSFT